MAASDRIAVGLIGLGTMGRGHLARLLGRHGLQVVAVCDVDQVRREEGQRAAEQAYAADRASGAYRGCVAYNDYRELLARPDIDAVVIATPDHWHTLLSVDAAKAGKDVYCEKPVSLTIQEGRRWRRQCARYGRVFQTGTQYRSMPTIRHGLRLRARRRAGPVTAAPSRSGAGAESRPLVHAGERTLPAEPVPDGLDWDLWVGPAPWHDYNTPTTANPIPGVVPWAFCEDFGAAP